MSADQDPTKGQKADSADAADKDLISLEDLDKVIQEEDPDFEGKVSDIAADAAAAEANIELLDLDELLAEQAARSFKSRVKRLLKKIRNFVMGLRTTLWHFLKIELPVLLKAGLVRLKAGMAVLREGIRQFGYKPLRFKLAVAGFIVVCGVSIAALVTLLKSEFAVEDRLFVQSIGEIAEVSHEVPPDSRREPFYDSVRAVQNVLAFTKMVVNLRPSARTGSNPMAALEIYVEGTSPDVILEMKARETEMRDLFMRAIEDFEASGLDSALGKQKLLDRLAREANRVVTKGRVRKVLLKTFVLKL